MLRSFVAWLDDYLAGEAPSALVKAVVGLLSFAALLGTLLGDLAVRAGSLVAVIFAVVSLGLMLLADRRSLRRRIDLSERLIAQYADFIRAAEQGYHLASFGKTIVVRPNGDSVETMLVRATVDKPDVQFFWLWFGCGRPQSARCRRRVDVRVRNLLDGDKPGTSLDRTLSWLADGRLVVIVHLRRRLEVGDDISVKLEVVWPGKCAPLMRGQCDDFTLNFPKGVDHVRYKIVLPKGCEAYCEPIGFRDGDAGFGVESGQADDGCSTYQIEACDLSVDRKVGLRLELKQRTPVVVG